MSDQFHKLSLNVTVINLVRKKLLKKPKKTRANSRFPHISLHELDKIIVTFKKKKQET